MINEVFKNSFLKRIKEPIYSLKEHEENEQEWRWFHQEMEPIINTPFYKYKDF